MKKMYIVVGALFLSLAGLAQGVTVGTNNPPDPSAALDLQSSNKGFLVPRLTTSQRNAIVNPAIGLEIYNTTTNCLQVYLPQSTWKDIVCDCQAPSSAFTFPNQIGPNAPASFSASTPGMIYSWIFQSGSPGTSTQQTVNVTWVNPGTYTVTLTVTDNSGCSSTTTQSITVTNCPPPGGNNMTFAYTGSMQSWTVPNCVTSIDVEAWGAEGGEFNGFPNSGGLGGYAKATIPVTPGEVLQVFVGGKGPSGSGLLTGGYNGGGGTNVQCPGDNVGAGGGASDIRRTPYALADRLLVGGGGGGSGYEPAMYTTQGGAGGGLNGNNGGTDSWCTPNCNGKGGAQLNGGNGGIRSGEPNADPGIFGDGGRGRGSCSGGGGGGGGWYGGGGGQATGGGGGSSYVDALGNTNKTTTPGLRAGNGQVVITY